MLTISHTYQSHWSLVIYVASKADGKAEILSNSEWLNIAYR